jgi:dTDP-4-dehydrorhamnose reductase
MSWLITGGTGQLGTALSMELSKRNISFISCSSKDLDISNAPSVLDKISKLAPSVVVNCAAWTNVDGAEANEEISMRINGWGAENVAVAAKSCGAKVVHISTDYVFSGETGWPWEINENRNPQTAYGRSKAEGEKRVLEAIPEDVYVIRTAWLYSPWGKNFVKSILKQAFSGESMVAVVDDQLGQPTSAGDLARQIVELVSSDSPPGIYHGTNAGRATWFEFAQEIFKLAGADVSRVVPVQSSEFPRPAKRPSNSVLSHAGWMNVKVAPMRDWRNALSESLPAIIFTVLEEE